MKKWFIPCISLILLAGCSDTEQSGQNNAPATEEPETTENTGTENNEETEAPDEPEQETEPLTEIAANLEIPWSINKTGDEFYISERTGSIAYIDPDGSLTRQPVEFSSPLSSAAEAGFLGFVLKEDFSVSSEAYA